MMTYKKCGEQTLIEAKEPVSSIDVPPTTKDGWLLSGTWVIDDDCKFRPNQVEGVCQC